MSGLLGYSVVNAGRSGDASSEGLKRLHQDVFSYSPKLVIIEFGGNDFLRRVPMSETIDNVRIMIEQIQSRGSMVAVADISGGMVMSSYYKAYKRLARQTGSIFIPQLLKGIIDNPSLKEDQIHPNAEGYRIIAQRVYQAIEPFVKKSD